MPLIRLFLAAELLCILVYLGLQPSKFSPRIELNDASIASNKFFGGLLLINGRGVALKGAANLVYSLNCNGRPY